MLKQKQKKTATKVRDNNTKNLMGKILTDNVKKMENYE